MIKLKNNTRIILIHTALAFATVPATALAAPDSAYQRAVDSYVTAAQNEVKAIRAQLDEALKSAEGMTKEQLMKVNKRMEACEELVAALREATPKQFDPLKTKYEQSRAVLLEEFAEAKQD